MVVSCTGGCPVALRQLCVDWLIAVGQREEGAPDDFYAALHDARTARPDLQAEHDPVAVTGA